MLSEVAPVDFQDSRVPRAAGSIPVAGHGERHATVKERSVRSSAAVGRISSKPLGWAVAACLMGPNDVAALEREPVSR